MPDSIKCAFQFADLRTCQRWANRGSRFCHNHQPPYRMNDDQYDRVHPLARLSTPDDVFNVIRESLNATRQGRMAPAQAFAVDRLANTWLKFHDRVRTSDRDKVLYQQMLPSLVDAESALDSARENHGMAEPVQSSVPGAVYQPTPPFPVQVDDFEVTSAAPIPRTNAEFKAWCDAMYAAKPESERIAQRQALESDPAYIAMRERERNSPMNAIDSFHAHVAAYRGASQHTTTEAPPPPATNPPASPSAALAPSSASPSQISDLRSAIPSVTLPPAPPAPQPSSAPRPTASAPSQISDLKSTIAPLSEISNLRSEVAPPTPPAAAEPGPAVIPSADDSRREGSAPPSLPAPPAFPSLPASCAPLFRKKAKRNGQPSALDKAIITTFLKQMFPVRPDDDS